MADGESGGWMNRRQFVYACQPDDKNIHIRQALQYLYTEE